MGIGKNSIVKRAIIDKNARIGENVKVYSVNVDEIFLFNSYLRFLQCKKSFEVECK